MSFSQDIPYLLDNPSLIVRKFTQLIQPTDDGQLEEMAMESRRLTRLHFGNAIRLFAPIYLSNECINNCKYCGFSRDNPIVRTTLSVDELVREARYLYDHGLRSILLVAGEHPKFVSDGYLQECLDALRTFIPSLGLEIGPLPDDRYAEIVQHGAESLTVFQETYNQEIYEQLHTAGNKKNYAWRLDCPERAYQGGFKKVGIGALFGLAPWRQEAKALATHIDYLQKHCWKSQLTISFPRMRPSASNYEYETDSDLMLNDRNMVQLMCALRICFPKIGFVVSTREAPAMRDSLMDICMTCMSAIAKTEPGGYTGAGESTAHLTVKGRQVSLPEEKRGHCKATEQFEISDERTPEQVVQALRNHGLEPVWKDWDDGLNG
ncbi:MAG: 2-iminoacetate synthase ThiH [Akkermansia sp.]